MRSRGLPAAVLAAANDREGGAMEVAATALDGLLEVAADPPRLEEAVAILLAGQPAMAPIWHLARAARDPDPPSALAALRRHLHADADAAVTTAAAWLRAHLSTTPGPVATVSHSSLVIQVLGRLGPGVPLGAVGPGDPLAPGARRSPGSRRQVPRWGSVAEPQAGGAGSSTRPVVGVVGADAIGPEALLNADGTRELAGRVPTLVVATAVKLVPAGVFGRLGGAGFEVLPLEALAAVVIGPEVLSPAEAGRRAAQLRDDR
jgi:hypothetical protein